VPLPLSTCRAAGGPLIVSLWPQVELAPAATLTLPLPAIGDHLGAAQSRVPAADGWCCRCPVSTCCAESGLPAPGLGQASCPQTPRSCRAGGVDRSRVAALRCRCTPVPVSAALGRSEAVKVEGAISHYGVWKN